MAKSGVEFDDWLALTEAKARYCRFLDSKDWAAFGDLMTDDIELDVSDGTGVPVTSGREKVVAQIRGSIETAVTAHQVHSPEIVLEGDEAHVTWAMQDRVVWSAEQPSIAGYGHYHERWRRVGDDWSLAALRLTRLHIDVIPPAADSPGLGDLALELPRD
ncbi:MAG: nuclear transport factor 2 family protein [Halioglobus sp.]|nr:nuclear transport factor 2 family protein [Halioglobus sp.]